jgi:hypothetical protein
LKQQDPIKGFLAFFSIATFGQVKRG